jgi:hypothetical protein
MMKRPPSSLLVGTVIAASMGMLDAANAATVPYPYIDVVQQGSDAGVSATGSTPIVTMQGTAVSVINGPGNVTSLPSGTIFSLTAAYSAALTAADGQPGSYDYANGTITIGSAGNAPLLTATFADLVMQSSGTSLLEFAIASSPLTYTGGSLAGSFSGGELVGSFTVTNYTPNAQGAADLSQDYTGANLTAKVGAVVPLPAAAWLLLSGLGGLAGLGALARRQEPGSPAPAHS